MTVTLEDTKLWIKVDGDYEDTLIESFIKTAEGMVEDILRFPLSDFAGDVPEQIKWAIYYCVSRLYEGRNTTEVDDLSKVLLMLLSSYRKADW